MYVTCSECGRVHPVPEDTERDKVGAITWQCAVCFSFQVSRPFTRLPHLDFKPVDPKNDRLRYAVKCGKSWLFPIYESGEPTCVKRCHCGKTHTLRRPKSSISILVPIAELT